MKSWVEISGERLVANLRAVQAAVGVGAEVLAVVKADGYGHGAALVAETLVESGALWLGVNDAEEGLAVRAAVGAGPRVLVMCGMEPQDAAAIVRHNLTPVVWTVDHLVALELAAEAAGQRLPVHVEVDSGMARQGASPGQELGQVLSRLADSQWVWCEGVLSHLACSEAAGSAVTAVQQQRFAAALEQVSAAEIRPELVHLANSSAVDEGSTLPWVRAAAERLGARVMVRPGLAIYGYLLESNALEGNVLAGRGETGTLQTEVRPVLTWKTRVTGVRHVGAGATVGYGATFVAAGPMELALLPVGYADGFRREASSGRGDGWVMVGGRKAAVVGRVSMNLTVVDVTGLSVAVGDEVVLLGEGVTAQDHARWCGTIAYDVLCGVRARPEILAAGASFG